MKKRNGSGDSDREMKRASPVYRQESEGRESTDSNSIPKFQVGVTTIIVTRTDEKKMWEEKSS